MFYSESPNLFIEKLFSVLLYRVRCRGSITCCLDCILFQMIMKLLYIYILRKSHARTDLISVLLLNCYCQLLSVCRQVHSSEAGLHFLARPRLFIDVDMLLGFKKLLSTEKIIAEVSSYSKECKHIMLNVFLNIWDDSNCTFIY